MARSAADAGLLLQVIGGADTQDPTALHEPVPDYLGAMATDLRGVRIGIDADWNGDGIDAEVQAVVCAAADVLRVLGATVVDVRVPEAMRAGSALTDDWAANCAVEAAVAHAASYPARRDEYGPVLASVIEAGRALSGIDYQRILLRRADLRGRMVSLLQTIDLLLTPVHPYAPLSLAAVRTLGEQPALIAGLQRYTCPFNLTGHPTITLPGGLSRLGLPIGFQLVAPHLGEAMLVRAGAAFQGATDWHRQHPVN